MLLSEMKAGQTAKISDINIDTVFAGRLRDMGFTDNEQVRCIRCAVLSSPILYNVKGSSIALRKSDADLIGVMI
jgi:Fe2+ transport system protein FeoA